MANRYTDTNKWKKNFLKSLPAAYKLLWLYICDDCDHAGIWHVDFEVAAIRLGETVQERVALEAFGEKIISFDRGEKWFIPSFIEFQYPGGLDPKNRAHASVIKILQKYQLIDGSFKTLTRPLEGYKDKVMDRDKDKDIPEGGAGETPPSYGDERYLIPQMLHRFKNEIPEYPDSPSMDGKALFAIAQFLCQRGNLRGDPSQHAEKVLEAWEHLCVYIAKDSFYRQKSLKTIANCIQEILQKALNGDQSKPSEKPGRKGLDADKLKAGLSARFAERRQGAG